MVDQANNRIDRLEQLLNKRNNQAPTIPVYDISDMPQDAITGQIAVGSDTSFNWYDGTSWNTQASVESNTGNIPTDAVDGQIAIGSDGGFNWCLGGIWYTAAFGPSIMGNVPQDPIECQIALGIDSTFHWYDGTNWQTFA